LLHPRPLQKQKAYQWRSFAPANNQIIWPFHRWIITPAFSQAQLTKISGKSPLAGASDMP
jgi:hypothetical protein